MGERITVGQYNRAILRGFHEGLSMAKLAHIFDCSSETVEDVVRQAMNEQQHTSGIVG